MLTAGMDSEIAVHDDGDIRKILGAYFHIVGCCPRSPILLLDFFPTMINCSGVYCIKK